MAATLTPKDIQADMQKYKQPTVYRGMPVIWHPHGIVSNRGAVVAFVTSCHPNRNNVALFIPGHRFGIRESVLHVSDPRLKLGNDQRENGAWDYTEAHLEDQKQRESLLDRIGSLEKKLAALEKKSAGNKTTTK